TGDNTSPTQSEIQTKVQAEPGDANKIDSDGYLVTEHAKSRWVGTGRKIYNNKGKPVKQYEPYFSHTPSYEDEAALVQWGVTPILFYDPLERVICTIHPNHTYEKVVFDPWYQETWDVNDTVLLLPQEDEHVKGYAGTYILNQENGFKTWYDQRIEDRDNPPNINRATPEQRAALLTITHSRTPGRAYLDSLGRPFLTVADNGEDQAGIRQLFETRVRLDIEGNDLEITDPRSIKAFTHRFDIGGRKIFVNSVDAGRSALLTDVAGNPIRSQDANGNVVRTAYDKLRRPGEVRVKESNNPEYLAQKILYGEALGNGAEARNHRGQVWKVYDGAGHVEYEAYDFKGNLLRSSRRLLKDAQNQVQWPTDAGGRLDETIAEELLMSGGGYMTQNEYDALSRIKKNKLPDNTVIRPEYNEAGLLDTVKVRNRGGAEQAFVENIEYNAKGQRTEIVYGNKVKSTYEYDPETFRLVELVSTRKPDSSPEKLQNISYAYDPVGNITEIRDDSVVAVPIWHAQTKIEPVCRYAYDPVYRLISAEGREHKSMTPSHYRDSSASKQSVYLEGPPHPNDTTALQMYEEFYSYDPSGNIEKIEHQRITNGARSTAWNRSQTYETSSNRIATSKCGSQQPHLRDELFAISHDANGNMLNLQPEKRPDPDDQRERQLKWNYQNQLVSVVLDRAGNKAFYQHDASGQRVRKYIVKNNGTCIEERIYLGGYEIYTKNNGSNVPVRRETIHVMDDKNRIALIENQVNSNSVMPRTRYQLNNDLGSSILEVDETFDANIISYEEYDPYGGSSYIAGEKAIDVSRKRYRYSGKERDDETGLYYYGAR
ncbi:MAG: hypothetical protein KAR13_01540, partial [Desulfobulbaceae bacterium]|nr:hypothetical protein [Desulfobulbaceae bacterium]